MKSRRMFFKGVVLGASTSMVVLVAATALAGSGLRGVFNLGVMNTDDGSTRLSGTYRQGPLLSVHNGSAKTGHGGPGFHAFGIDVAGSFDSPGVGVRANGANDGVRASSSGASQSGVWAHHDGNRYGYGLFAQSRVGPAIGMRSPVDRGTPMTLDGQPFPGAASASGFASLPKGGTDQVAALHIPAGTTALFAEGTVTANDSNAFPSTTTVTCSLDYGTEHTPATVLVKGHETESISLALVGSWPTDLSARFSCFSSGNGPVAVEDGRLVGIHVAGRFT